MNKYMIAVVLFSIAFIVVSIIGNILSSEKKGNKIKKSRGRGRSSSNERFATNSVKKQLSEAINEKANINKRYNMETMCLQAGHKMSYGEYVILAMSSAIVLPILLFLLTKNIFLILIFAFIGYQLPGQYLKHRANKRISVMEKQVGSFMRIVLERYKTTNDMAQSFVQALPDFKGYDPLYSILKNSVAELKMGKTIEDTLDGLVRETGNIYFSRFTDYYKMSTSMASSKDKIDLLSQAYEQYDDNEKMKATLKEKISGPKNEAYIMVVVVPIFFVYQSFFTEGYLDFMLNTPTGQMGLAGSVALLLACIWFINVKLGAPIE